MTEIPGYNYQPISLSIHKVWTNQKPENLALSLANSDRLASFIRIGIGILFKLKKNIGMGIGIGKVKSLRID